MNPGFFFFNFPINYQGLLNKNTAFCSQVSQNIYRMHLFTKRDTVFKGGVQEIEITGRCHKREVG
jgi:hypothetical protein